MLREEAVADERDSGDSEGRAARPRQQETEQNRNQREDRSIIWNLEFSNQTHRISRRLKDSIHFSGGGVSIGTLGSQIFPGAPTSAGNSNRHRSYPTSTHHHQFNPTTAPPINKSPTYTQCSERLSSARPAPFAPLPSTPWLFPDLPLSPRRRPPTPWVSATTPPRLRCQRRRSREE